MHREVFLVLLAFVTAPAWQSIAQAGEASAPEGPRSAPRVALYGTLADAIAAHDLYGAIELMPPTGEALDKKALAAQRNDFFASAKAGCAGILAQMLRAGEQVYAVDASGTSALHLAAAAGRIYTMDVLIHQGASIMQFDGDGFLPLHAAAKAGQPAALEALFEYGTPLSSNAREPKGRQVNMVALDNHQFEVSRLLRRLGVVTDIFPLVINGDKDGALQRIKNDPGSLEQEDGQKNTPLLVAVRMGDREMVEMLIGLGAQVATQNLDGRDVLALAVKDHHLDLIPTLLQAGASLNVRSGAGLHESLTQVAVDYATPEELESLVRLGAPLDVKDSEGFTPLHRAFQRANRSMTQTLLKLGANPRTKDNHGRSLLHTAADDQHADLIALALDNGVPADSWDERRQTPLHYACREKSEALFDLLISHHALTDLRDADGRTPFMVAAASGNDEMLRRLLSNSIDLNEADEAGQTALHLAVLVNSEPCTHILVEAGANLNALDRDGWPPIYYALHELHGSLARFLEEKGADMRFHSADGRSLLFVPMFEDKPDLVPWLLGLGLPPDEPDVHEWTPLHQAAMVGSENTVGLLLQRGIDPNVTDDSGKTPLHVAARRGHILVVKALTVAGAKEDVRDANGWLPIHYAAASGHWGPIQLFLQNGIDINATTPNGRTPFQLACEGGMVRTAMVLIDRGADMLHADDNGRDALQDIAESRTVVPSDIGRTPKMAENELRIQLMHNYLRMAYADLMHSLIERGDDASISKLLQAHPEFANLVFEGWTPLQQAVRSGHADVVKQLLQSGARPEGTDEVGNYQTSLHVAVSLKLPDIAALLAQANPKTLSMHDALGRTPADLAVAAGAHDLAKLLQPPKG